MRITIIEPYHYDRRYDVRSLTPALGAVVLATWLTRNGHQAKVLSEYVSKLDPSEVERADLVGLSITTYNATRGYELARGIKKPIVFGGLHASLRPEECLRYGDYVIQGDGHPILDLADTLEKGRLEDLHRVANLVYRDHGRIIYNKRETKILDIVPDFGLIKDYYRFNLKRLLRIPLLAVASRGCAFECRFCSVKAVYSDFRQKEPRTVIEDILSQVGRQPVLSKLFPRGVWIVDDNFLTDREWAKSLLRGLAKIRTDHVLVIQARMDIANDGEMLELMRRANISRIYLGIESLSPESLDNFNKRSAIRDPASAVRRIRCYGMDVHGLFIFGDDAFKPGDGLRVAEFVRRHHLSGLLIQPLTPFPGTETFEKLKQENRLLHEEWQDYGGKVVFRPKHLSAAALQQEISACYKKVYSPLNLMKFLFFGRRGYRLGTLGEGIMRHREAARLRHYIKDRLMDRG